MEKKTTVAHQLRATSNKAGRLAESSIPAAAKREVTEGQGRIIGFLYHNRDRDVFQRDVEAEFSITRATASKMLSSMERSGLVRRSAVEGDARLKKLELTEKSMAHRQRIRSGMQKFEADLTRDMTEEEQETLIRLLQKVEHNAEESLRLLRGRKEKDQC